MSEPGKPAEGLVPVSYHRFYLLELPTHEPPVLGPQTPVLFPNGLITTQPGISVITTGIASGTVTVAVERHDHAPPLDVTEWDEVVEVALETPHGRVVLAALDADLPRPLPDLSPQGPGQYRLRLHARGRDTAVDLAVLEPVEDYLLQIWPAPATPEIVHKQTDSYGAAMRHLTAAR